MYPGTYAAEAPDRIAAVMAGTGETLSYGALERRAAPLAHMLYSSGTTGRPTGVRPALPDRQVTEPGEALAGLASMFFGVNQDSVYLSPGPIYHAAPLRWCGSIQVLGGTVVMTKRFDAEQVLAAIGDHHVTHAQFVPTMFVRMLQLPQDTRARYDVSSLDRKSTRLNS